MTYDLAEMVKKASEDRPERFLMRLIENAVIGERERCAKVVEAIHQDPKNRHDPADSHALCDCDMIAAAIRNPQPAPVAPTKG